MTKITSPTARQVVRSYNTIQTRRAAMMTAWDAGHGWRRKAAGVRRAKAKTLRLMAEYFGVGEDVPGLCRDVLLGGITQERFEHNMMAMSLNNRDERAAQAWYASSLRTELARDRGEVRITRASA